jgi:maleate isomerase
VSSAIRLGILTPSSNTALEPLSSTIVAQLPGVSVHFSRFTVTEIALGEQATAQFDAQPVLAAARLLADARVHAIGWSGTSASWLGFEHDQALCARLRAETGVPATTSVLALNELLALADCHEFALFTPYTTDVQQRIVANYRHAGLRCTAQRHLGIRVNYDFAAVAPERIERDCREMLASAPVPALVTLCTNLRAAHLAAALERDLGVLMLDSVSTVLWKLLHLAGRDAAEVQGFGRLFALPPSRAV